MISNIVDFGAFVDLEGIDGLIHISELSWSHVNHPSEVLTIGEKVEVKVLDIDRERQRISLGLKQTQADPWQSVIDRFGINDVVEGKVTKVVTFGAFVEIHPGVEGLVHISELASHHVENPREVVSQGDTLSVRIIEIDPDRRRLSLSLKRVADVEGAEHCTSDDEYDAPADLDATAEVPAEAVSEEPAQPEEAGEPRGGGGAGEEAEQAEAAAEAEQAETVAQAEQPDRVEEPEPARGGRSRGRGRRVRGVARRTRIDRARRHRRTCGCAGAALPWPDGWHRLGQEHRAGGVRRMWRRDALER